MRFRLPIDGPAVRRACMHAEAARTEGPAWEHSLVPVSLVADGDAARDAALHDVVARINSLKQEEWTPYAEEMAALDAQLPPPAEAFARTLYCTGVLQQSMSDLLQVLPSPNNTLRGFSTLLQLWF